MSPLPWDHILGLVHIVALCLETDYVHSGRRDMGTRGDVTVVVDDHFYSHYQHSGMYHDGHMAELLAEAADITRADEWDAIVAGWTSKAWLVDSDDDLPRSLRDTVRHPDGDKYQRSDWANAMRPRFSHLQMVKAGYAAAADEVFRVGGKHPAPTWEQPSWRAAAEMPAMLKSDFADHAWGHYGVVVDVDNREIVCLAYRTRGDTDWPSAQAVHVPIAVASLDDAEAIQSLADWARERGGVRVAELDPPPPADALAEASGLWVYPDDDVCLESHPSVGGPPITPLNPYESYQQRVRVALSGVPDRWVTQVQSSSHTSRNWIDEAPNLRDGQWLRPDGFPPLKGTPQTFPAQRGTGFSPSEALSPSAAPIAIKSPLCGHVGARSGRPCIRLQHKDRHHRYQ